MLIMSKSQIFPKSLNLKEDYPCPVCKVGKIGEMPLMEAMCCNFCQEIFTVNIEQQQLKMPSREPALTWHWNGFKWTQTQILGVELGWPYQLAAVAFVILPTSLVAITAYYFPPSPHVTLYWLPYIWTILTFIAHLTIILWLWIEIYQIPVTAYLQGINRWWHNLSRR